MVISTITRITNTRFETPYPSRGVTEKGEGGARRRRDSGTCVLTYSAWCSPSVPHFFFSW